MDSYLRLGPFLLQLPLLALLVAVWTGESAILGTKTEKAGTRALSADGRTMSVTSVRGTKPPMVMVYEKQK